MSINQKNVVITGGAGFIGAHLTQRLQKKGYATHVIDNFSNYNNLSPELTKKIQKQREKKYAQSKLHQVDLATDPEGLAKVFYQVQPKLIFHCADLSVARLAQDYPEKAKLNIEQSTNNLLKSLETLSFERLIYLSSSMVYGNFQSEYVLEEDELRPVNKYGELKKKSEENIQQWSSLHNNFFTICRLMSVYGPYDSNERVLYKIFDCGINKKKFILHGHQSRMAFSYVEDVCQGLLSSGESKEAKNEIFNISGDRAYSLLEVILFVKEKYFPDFEYGVIEPKIEEPLRGSLSIEKARRKIDFNPGQNFYEGLDEFYLWMKDLLIRERLS